MIKESKLRSVVKTVSWRLWATLTTILIVYFFVGDPTVAITVGGIEVFLKMLVYFVHERLWEKIRFGRREVRPLVVWITGLSRSGKRDIGHRLTEKLRRRGYKVEHLDGHSIRELFPETGYRREDVNRHIKRVGFLARKLEEQGVVVVASFLSPYAESRRFVRKICGRFFEVYISTPAEVCAGWDDKGVYARAARGEIADFPGVSAAYEEPQDPDLVFDTTTVEPEKVAEKIFNRVLKFL